MTVFTIHAVNATIEENDVKTPLTFSHNLIKEHNYENAQNFGKNLGVETSENPFLCASFSNDGKTLDFVGTVHDNNPDSKIHTLTKNVLNAFAQTPYDPAKKVVILEGFTPQDATGSLHHIPFDILQGKQTYGELELAFELARTNNIAAFTGEKTYQDMGEKFIKNGFSFQDHYWLTQALYLSESLYFKDSLIDLSSQSITEILGAHMDRVNKDFPENPPFNPDQMITDLTNWMNEKFGRPLTTQEIGDITCPNHTQNHYSTYTDSEHYLVKLKSFHQLQRDHDLLSRIESLMNQYDHVMVVYGSFHYYALHDALSEKLGNPIYTFV